MKKKYEGLKDDCGCVCCPACERLFSVRKQGCCPLCKTRLVFPGEYFAPGGDGFYFSHGDWHKIADAGKMKSKNKGET